MTIEHVTAKDAKYVVTSRYDRYYLKKEKDAIELAKELAVKEDGNMVLVSKVEKRVRIDKPITVEEV